MALTQQTYLFSLRKALQVSLCLRDFPSEKVERHNKPEVEMQCVKGENAALILNPIFLARSEKEKCYIEPSINSTRVNLSFKQNDPLDSLIVDRFCKFMAQRAEQAKIVRKVPVPGYDLSFLVMNSHLEVYDKNLIIEFILSLVE